MTSESANQTPDVPRRIEPLQPSPRPAVRAWAERYGFSPELVARWVAYLPEPQEVLASLVRPVGRYVRINTLHPHAAKVADALRAREFVLEDVPAPDPRLRVFRVVKEPYAISATPEYLGGVLYLQDLASLSAVAALAPEPGDLVLDMAAAPGGKTTAIAELTGDEASILAVEPVPARAAALTTNLRRLGVHSAAVVVMGAESVDGNGRFDRILLDAPCTGEGVLPRDPKRRRGVLEEHAHLAGLQRRLLAHAVRLLRPGGVLVYSTCTFAPEECEEVVVAATQLGLEPEPLPFDELGGQPLAPALASADERTYGDAVRHARRIYPHQHGTLGFFVARLRKPVDWVLPDDAPFRVPEGPEPGQVVRVGRAGRGAVNTWDDDDAGDASTPTAKKAAPKERTKKARPRADKDEELVVETTGLSDVRFEGDDDGDGEGDGAVVIGERAADPSARNLLPAEIRDLHPPEQEALAALLAPYGAGVMAALTPGDRMFKVLGRPDLKPQRRVIIVDRRRVADLARFGPTTIGMPIATLARVGGKLTLEGGGAVARVATAGKAGVREKGEQLFLYGRDVLGKSLAWVDKGTPKGSTVLVLEAATRRYLGLAALAQERRFLGDPRTDDETFLRHLVDLGRYLRAQQGVPE